ncbi:MAG: right-handed parallel beta-helix repeat-containing protein, partial [Planctomycetota bacterium]
MLSTLRSLTATVSLPISPLVLVLALTVPAFGQMTWYVDAAAAPGGSGGVGDPFATIQEAISASTTVDEDTILVRPGTYSGAVDYSGKSIAIRSMGGRDVTVLDLASSDAAVRVRSGEGQTTLLEGFTVENARTSPGNELGSGLLMEGSSLSVVDCAFLDCGLPFQVVPEGGAVGARNSTLSMTRCVLRGNYGERAGAVYLDGCSASFVDCEVRSNGAESGDWGAPGLWASQSTVTIQDTVFTGNGGKYVEAAVHMRDCESTLDGVSIVASHNVGGVGSISIWRGTSTLTGCEISHGSSYDTAHLFVWDADLTVRDTEFSHGIGYDEGCILQWDGNTRFERCMFTQNRGDVSGAFLQEGGTSRFTDCSFVDNISTVGVWGPQASAILVDDGGVARAERCFFRGNQANIDLVGPAGSTVRGNAELVHCTLTNNAHGGTDSAVEGASLDHCIVWGNTGPNQQTVLGAGVRARWSNVEGGWPGAGNLSADPQLDAEQRLAAGSPCIDAGDDAAPMDADGSPPEMGADRWEWPSLGGAYCTANVNSTGLIAETHAFGSASSSSGPLYVVLHQLPPQQFTLLLTSQVSDSVSLGGGILCLGHPLARFQTQVQLSGLDGRASVEVNKGQMPMSPNVAIQP